VLQDFPDFDIRCEGHTKGKPDENNDARIRLSLIRAEAVKRALLQGGVTNAIICEGFGSIKGLGMCVKMFAPEADETAG